MGYSYASFIEHEYKLPECPDPDFGKKWPVSNSGLGVNQITKDLMGFRFNGTRKGFLSRFEHGLRLVEMLWPNEVRLYQDWKDYRTGETVRIWNHYFMEIFHALCHNKRVALTGCASSGKTFACAVYAILLFMSNPENTTVLVSTTSGSDAERRIWGEIKSLHNALKATFQVGVLIDYIKVITFDPGRELWEKKSVEGRDVRNGISLKTIPEGAEGEKAIGSIVGTKQPKGNILWIVDELANLFKGVLRPVSNLEFGAIHFQMVGIANAKDKNDPHGEICEPEDGWSSFNERQEEWMSRMGYKVVFCHGERSPNFHPSVDPTVTDREKLPYPYLSNRPALETIAKENGRGDRDRGRYTLDYIRFGKGCWYGDDIQNTILSEEMVKENKANRPLSQLRKGWQQWKTTWGFDPAWSGDGDDCELFPLEWGRDMSGEWAILFPDNSITVRATTENKEDFRNSIARQVVEIMLERDSKPEDLFMDTNGDGALMYRAIVKAFEDKKIPNASNVVALSSLEASDNPDRFKNIVTQYWYQAQDIVTTGYCWGFNILSSYARQLFERKYFASGRGQAQVEPKKDMKKRIGRSPDAGDSACYAVEGAKRQGCPLIKDSPSLEEDQGNRLDDLVLRRGQPSDSDFASKDEVHEIGLAF